MSKNDFLSYIRETDARNDHNFSRYRVETQAHRRLASSTDRAFLAVGLKGIGKTACFASLRDDDGVDVIQPINTETQEPQDVPTERPTLQYLPEIRSELVFQSLIALRKKIKSDPTFAHKIPQDICQEVEVLLTALWKRASSLFGSLGGITVLGCGISFRNKSPKDKEFKLVPREDYDRAYDILSRAAQKVTFRIVVDDPETIFTSDQHINENLVAALALAAHELRTKLLNFKCVVLIKPNVLQELRKVDEFVNLPPDAVVRLFWTDNELKDVIRRRADAAKVKLRDAFEADPEPALTTIVQDSRSGPRDALRRLGIHFDAYPNEPVTPASLERTIDKYSDACYEQMYGAYERQYPGLARAAIALFERGVTSIKKSNIREGLNQVVASGEVLSGPRMEPWALDSVRFADLLVQLGMVAVDTPSGKVLPFHSNYLDGASKADAAFTLVPGLRGRLISGSPAKPTSPKPKRAEPRPLPKKNVARPASRRGSRV